MTFSYQRLLGMAFTLILSCSFTASVFAKNIFANEDPVRKINPDDPYESFNRPMFTFNDYFDKIVLKPIATLYSKIVPKPLVKGISNVYSNIDTVPTVINDVLQINIYQASNDLWRLLINSTIGIGGLFDVATDMGLQRNAEDFGLTLARWGYEKSNYLVIPFLGPSTVRDTIAWPVNYQYMTIYPLIHRWKTRYAIYGLGVVSKRADYLRFQDVMQQAAIDKYVFVRDAYLQKRAYQIDRNKQLTDPYLDKNSVLSPDNRFMQNEVQES